MQDHILDNLRKNWFIVIFFGSLIMSWTSMTMKVSTLEDKTAALELQVSNQNNALSKEISDMKIQLTEIQANVNNLTNIFKNLDVTYLP